MASGLASHATIAVPEWDPWVSPEKLPPLKSEGSN
jgi:hypothetical protein